MKVASLIIGLIELVVATLIFAEAIPLSKWWVGPMFALWAMITITNVVLKEK